MTFAHNEVESGKFSVSVHSAPQSDLSTQGPQDVLPGAVIRVSDESAVTPGATISPPDEVCSAWHSADWAGAGAQEEQLSFSLQKRRPIHFRSQRHREGGREREPGTEELLAIPRACRHFLKGSHQHDVAGVERMSSWLLGEEKPGKRG